MCDFIGRRGVDKSMVNNDSEEKEDFVQHRHVTIFEVMKSFQFDI